MMKTTDKLRIALAQINTVVGDLEGNRDKIISYLHRAQQSGCHLLAFPELAISGYPPEDLLHRRQFVIDQQKILHEIVGQAGNTVCIVGYVNSNNGRLYNAAAVIQNKRLLAVYNKINLPNYSVFDEERYFHNGQEPLVLTSPLGTIGLSICEDIWIENNVTESEAFCGGAQLLLNISASPYHTEKGLERRNLMSSRARATVSYVAYCNLVGGQDELVFDGRSLIAAPNGEIIAVGKAFEEDFVMADLDLSEITKLREVESYKTLSSRYHNKFTQSEHINLSLKAHPLPFLKNSRHQQSLSSEEEVYEALRLGLKDYVRKNGFKKVTLGLSGGIDSALVATLAVDALGKENVTAVSMPSRYSSPGSVNDARLLAENLGIRFLVLPIEKAFIAYLEILKEPFYASTPDVAEENIQARIRGNLVMALSNKFGWLVLATGNKSEVSVGYATIYGDMAGGFAPLKDVSKMMVYRLCEYRNSKEGRELIPGAIIEKAPSAELRPGQKDEDSLPPYEVLDKILEYYVESEKSVNEIVSQGFEEETVRAIARLVDVNEYKRRQAAPGTKITPRAFGKDRRMPITNSYRAR